MTERVTTCLICGSNDVETIRTLDPDTTELIMNVDFKCNKCGKISIHEVNSNHYKKLRRAGRII